MTKILFVDCDGTIREPITGQWIQPYDNQQIMQGADQAIAHYHAQSFTIIGISNQAGVAARHKTLADCIAEQAYTLTLLPQIEGIYFCPDYDGEECYYVSLTKDFGIGSPSLRGKFRKPNIGMLVYALWQFPGVKTSDCWMVGDRPEDEQAAAAAGINFLAADIWRERWKDSYVV